MSAVKFYLSAILCSLLIAASSCSSSFPSDLQRCRYADTTCIATASTALIRAFAKTGNPAASFPSIDPFVIRRVDISDGRSGSAGLKLKFIDMNVEGMSGVHFDRIVGFEKDPTKSKFELYGKGPTIKLSGKYTADGRILILPIKGDGAAEIGLLNPKFSVKFKPTIVNQNGKNHLQIDKLKILLEPERMTISLSNLFNGDPTLGPNLNTFLNENWSDVWSELQPSIHSALGEVIKSIVAGLFKKFPYEDLFLEE